MNTRFFVVCGISIAVYNTIALKQTRANLNVSDMWVMDARERPNILTDDVSFNHNWKIDGSNSKITAKNRLLKDVIVALIKNIKHDDNNKVKIYSKFNKKIKFNSNNDGLETDTSEDDNLYKALAKRDLETTTLRFDKIDDNAVYKLMALNNKDLIVQETPQMLIKRGNIPEKKVLRVNKRHGDFDKNTDSYNSLSKEEKRIFLEQKRKHKHMEMQKNHEEHQKRLASKKLKEQHNKKVNEIREFLKDRYKSTNYLYDEMKRILKTHQIKNKIRRLIEYLEHPGMEKLKYSTLDCALDRVGLNKQMLMPDIWKYNEPNNLVIEINHEVN